MRYNENQMRVLTLLSLIAGFFTMSLNAETTPEWMIPLRVAVYEQKLNAGEIEPLYFAAKTAAEEQYSGSDFDLAISRCEYFMGRAFQDNKQTEAARSRYKEGMRLAEKVANTAPNAEAWLLLAQNLSQACSLGPWTYTVANGLNVEKYAKNALTFDRRNAAAQYLIAARWVFAPSPFNNIKKGIEMMEAILQNGDTGKDDLFNVYSAIGYGYVQQKKYGDARPWLQKSLEIYPTNKYAGELLEKK